MIGRQHIHLLLNSTSTHPIEKLLDNFSVLQGMPGSMFVYICFALLVLELIELRGPVFATVGNHARDLRRVQPVRHCRIELTEKASNTDLFPLLFVSVFHFVLLC